jgi:hypothetical protein
MTAPSSGCGFTTISTLQPGQITFGVLRLMAMIAASRGSDGEIRLFRERPGQNSTLTGVFDVNVV